MTTNDSAAPIVSVIVDAGRTRHELACTLSSVDDQTFSDFEVIVVDDRDPGGRNAAIARSRGRWLAFLQTGDLWTVAFLQRQVSYLEAHPWCDVVYAAANLCGDPPPAGRRLVQPSPPSGRATLVDVIEERCAIRLSTVVARRDAILQAGAFDERLEHRQDYALWLRLAQRGARIAAQRHVLADCRVTPGDPVRDLQQTLEVLEHVGRHYVLPADARRALRRRSLKLLDRIDVELARRRLLDGNFVAAKYHLAASRTRSLRLMFALLALRVAPRAARRLVLVANSLHVHAAAVLG